MSVPLCVRIILPACCAVLRLHAQSPSSGTPTPAPAPEATVFSTDSVSGQVLALTVDDSGRVHAARTTRSFNRGALDLPDDPDLLRQDRRLRASAGRAGLLGTWLAAGRLDAVLRERSRFFPDPEQASKEFPDKYRESVLRLADTDRDGAADTAEVLAEGFQADAGGPGGALTALPGGKLLYGCPPRLWRLAPPERGAGPFAADPVPEGDFGIRFGEAEHGLHALLEASDGWVYFGVGDRGYCLSAADGSRQRNLRSGAILRCRPDGSRMEEYASGLRNPTGLAMDPAGHLFAVDQAAPGGQTRLLHVIPGADFGWSTDFVTGPGEGRWFSEEMEPADGPAPGEPPSPDRPQWCLPALAPLELEASALECLGDGSLLAADRAPAGKGGLVRLNLSGTPTRFQLTGTADVWRGGAVMATAQDPDGGLYFADWGEKADAFSRCRILHLTFPGATGHPAGPATPLIAGIPGLAVRELKTLLDSPQARVRQRARQRLSSLSFQDSLEALLHVARHGPTLTARVEGLRGAGLVASQDPVLMNELLPFFRDPLPEIRAAAARAMGSGNLPSAPPALRRALTDEVPAVRLAAAAALARTRLPEVIPDLLLAAENNTARDPWIRSSLAHAMARNASPVLLAEAGSAADLPEIRLTVVLALRRLSAPELSAFLSDPDETVRTEAARAIYDLPVPAALPALAASLDPDSQPLTEAFSRRALAAAVRQGTAEDAARTGRFASSPAAPASLRLDALRALELWDLPPETDPLRNRPFRAWPRLAGLGAEVLRGLLDALKSDADTAISARALVLAGSPAGRPVSASSRLAIVRNAERSGAERSGALESLIREKALSPAEAVSLTDSGMPPPVRATARAFLMRRDPAGAVALLVSVFPDGTVLEKQTALSTLNHLPGNGNGNEKLLLEWCRRLGQRAVEPAIQVEVLEILERRDQETRSPWRKATESWLASLPTDQNPLAPWLMTMEDGDPDNGRRVFETNAEAGCAGCHAVAGEGGTAGPDLDGIGSRLTPGGILQSLVHPSAKFADGFTPRTGATGTDNSVSPVGEDGPISPMPPAGSLLTLRELRDLIAWLKSLKEES